MSNHSNNAPSAASSRPASTRLPALRAEEPVRRSARLCNRNPATWAVTTPLAVGLEATASSSPAAGEQPIKIVAAEQLVALRSTPRPLEPLFLGSDAAGEEDKRLEAMEVEESVVGRVSEAGEDPVAPLVGPHVPNYLKIALWAELFIAPVLLVFVACEAWPPTWVVSEGSVAAGCLHRLVLLRLTKGCMPWPSWQCARCAKLGIPTEKLNRTKSGERAGLNGSHGNLASGSDSPDIEGIDGKGSICDGGDQRHAGTTCGPIDAQGATGREHAGVLGSTLPKD
ncbi:uncharacterized protein MEPE_05416 [Melanopsichium pennsylvanicum]|uniref:Uncharacterized protein n=1 Tax=Melanopsichium pennsylvanicum TaxID=63383 RepID=A0AAJ4XQT5_9BASI|nr:uncharacterized protein MEPE_05416 [Melanopsichium pennsylvanicum]